MKYLIKDTTREEREEIVKRGLNCDTDGCAGCSACGIYGVGDVTEAYKDYIEGKAELAEISARYRGGGVR